jgi:hypothetical protein
MGKPSLLITPTAVESIECRIMRTDDAREIAVAPHPPIDAESPFSGRREDGLQVEVFVNGAPVARIVVRADIGRIPQPMALQVLRESGIAW